MKIQITTFFLVKKSEFELKLPQYMKLWKRKLDFKMTELKSFFM